MRRKEIENLDYLARFILISTLHMLGFQVYLTYDDFAVVLDNLSDLSNLTFIVAGYHFYCISQFHMHFV